jgi:hypothetical protein
MEQLKEDKKNTFTETLSHYLTCEWWKIKGSNQRDNAFNNFFKIIAEKFQHIEKGDTISVLKELFPGYFPRIKLFQISKTNVSIIQNTI